MLGRTQTREQAFEEMFPNRTSQEPFWDYFEASLDEDLVLEDGETHALDGTWINLPEPSLYVITVAVHFDGGTGAAWAYRRGVPTLAAHEARGSGAVARTWVAEIQHGTRLEVCRLSALRNDEVTVRANGTRLQVVGPLSPTQETGL